MSIWNRLAENRNGAGYWTQRRHLFGRDEFVCSVCGASCDRPYGYCPACGTEMRGRPGYDPAWVEEAVWMEEIFGDDDGDW